MKNKEIENFEKKYCKKCKDTKLCDKGIRLTEKEVICIDKNIHELRKNLK